MPSFQQLIMVLRIVSAWLLEASAFESIPLCFHGLGSGRVILDLSSMGCFPGAQVRTMQGLLCGGCCVYFSTQFPAPCPPAPLACFGPHSCQAPSSLRWALCLRLLFGEIADCHATSSSPFTPSLCCLHALGFLCTVPPAHHICK